METKRTKRKEIDFVFHVITNSLIPKTFVTTKFQRLKNYEKTGTYLASKQKLTA